MNHSNVVYDINLPQNPNASIRLVSSIDEILFGLFQSYYTFGDVINLINSFSEWCMFADRLASYVNSNTRDEATPRQVLRSAIDVLSYTENEFVTRARLIDHLEKDVKLKRNGYAAIALAYHGILKRSVPRISDDAARCALEYVFDQNGERRPQIVELLSKGKGSLAESVIDYLPDTRYRETVVRLLQNEPMTDAGEKLYGMLRNHETKDAVLAICKAHNLLDINVARSYLGNRHMKKLAGELLHSYIR